jgi:bifunctional non-homologous end joining protein LigD
VSEDSTRGTDLERYRAKRDFTRTPEPAGGPHASGQPGVERRVVGDGPAAAEASPDALRFVVQRHRARRTHYDFRLEVDGVLASWAVPKGPTLDPSVRTLAVHVEDHPIEYRDFEGVIPAGEYGGGDVIVWDRGTWVPSAGEDPAGAIAAGELHFDLYGEKLRGRFALVRTRRERSQEQWLMIHKHDDAAVEGWNPDEHPLSVKSGRTNDEVAAAPDAMWRSDLPASEAEVTVHDRRRTSPSANDAAEATSPSTAAIPWDGPDDDELTALDDLGKNGTWTLRGQDLRLTNLDKELFPARDGDPAVTKRDLIRYYSTIAPAMLPFLEGRPVNLHRFPNGSGSPGFWHKQVPSHAPEWITRWRQPDGDGESYFVVDSVPALAWMANYAAVELHPWTSRVTDVSRPTWALIDIDPGAETTAEDVLTIARVFRAGLDHLRVRAAAKVSGRRGIHIWVPVEPRYSFRETSSWVEKLSRAVGATIPDLVSWTWQKSERGGLARLDYTQNAINKTLVAPYSTRPAPGAPVSVPILWDELDDDRLRGDGWTVRSVAERVADVGDPFAGLVGLAQALPPL